MAKSRQPVCIQGHKHSHEFSNTGSTLVSLSTSALRGIKVYAPDDLYITVGAGTSFLEIQQFLAQEKQQIALASPWPEATIGGLVATNTNAPLRMRYGSMRDSVLSTTIAMTNGDMIRTGRPLVKNVAGYDLTKVFVGSYGTLGLIADITLKVIALPRACRTLLIPITDLRQGLVWGRQLLPLALNASALIISKSSMESIYQLVYTAEGMPKEVQAELDQVRHVLHEAGAPEPIEVEAPSGTELWTNVLGESCPNKMQVRIGVPNRALPVYIQDQAALLNSGLFCADLSSGLIYVNKEVTSLEDANVWLAALRNSALAAEGYAIVISMPMPGKIDRWGYQSEGWKLMKGLKTCWDPQNILNPGMFVGGI